MTRSRSLDTRPMHNLPSQPTPFVGRNRELAELSALLDNSAIRLVTILGPGGMGKTRLAFEVAAEQLSQFADGVYFVPLAPLSSPDNIVTAVAEAVGFQFFGAGDPAQQLFDFFRTKTMLLVLDNFEHLLDGASIISNLLAYAADINLLVTSRARLNLRGETIFVIDGLKSPAGHPSTDLLAYDAVQLFLQTARQANPGYELTENDAEHVARICELVQGMPLGIELAATWVDMLPLADIAAEIEASLDFLATDMYDMPERLRSIRAVFERSWNLLSGDERDIFKKLSVFRGGFSREAGQVVAGASLRHLTALVHKSLLGRPDSSGRYAVHELLRQYAAEKLEETPDEQERVFDRHCDYYAEFLRQREEGTLRGAEHERDVLQELDNIRVAWQWAVTRLKSAEIRKMINGLHYVHEFQGTWLEGASTFEWAAETIRLAPPDDELNIALGSILAAQGFFFRRIARGEQAKVLNLESIAILRRLGDREALAWAYIHLSKHGTSGGPEVIEDYDELRQVLHEARTIFEEAGHSRGFAWSLLTLGNVAREHADYDRAMDYYNQGLQAARDLNSPREIVWALWGLALCVISQDNQEDGQDHELLRADLAEFLNSGVETGPRLALYLTTLGVIEYMLGDYPSAWATFCKSLQMVIENPYIIPDQLDNLLWISRILAQRGEVVPAVEIFTLIQDHAETRAELRAIAEDILSDLQAELPADAFAAAQERGRNLQMDALIAQIARDCEETRAYAVASAHSGDDLTEREREILQLVAEGRSNREIATELVIALGTVKWYVSQIYSKLYVQNRAEAVYRARDLGLLS